MPLERLPASAGRGHRGCRGRGRLARVPGPAAALAAVVVSALCLQPAVARACASCGSGTGDPLILYPHERAKVYLGLSRSSARQFLTSDGQVGAALGPTAQEALTLSLGLAITPRGFVTITLPGLRNSAAGAWATGLGDPSMAARWTAVRESPARPWVPQVQAVVGLRPGLARSGLAGTALRRDELDRFGEGSDEARLGVDLWWATLPVKAGLATFWVAPLPVPVAGGGTSRAGSTWRLVLTGGADLGRRARLLITLLRDDQADRRTRGVAVADSGRTLYSVLSTLELYVRTSDTIRLSVGRGAVAWSHDATRDISVSAAWMHAW